ncbi:hypothetical protein SteCoe_36648 [Stentor coeruleus]|uniref:RNA helicase n=1 Tax=Stentor coeruleus TaxID=5963 RepID=A0A1R2AQ17_9CILI|nr:hypothetical protein SteCoe_36648 [Stentor coeruleus]
MEQTEELIINQNWHEVTETFEDMNLKEPLLRGIYSYGFEKPTAIQQKVIKPIILGHDTFAQAQSGTGKTAAYTIVVLELIDTSVIQCQALILTPARELAQGICRVILQIGQYSKINCHACIGGNNVREDIRILEKGVHIVIGTPGRVFDMISRNHLSTQNLKIFILEEVDEILSRGFKDQIKKIFKHLPGSIQCCLFSATMAPEILKLTNNFMREPIRIIVKKDEFTLEGITQYYIPIEKEDWKFTTLVDLYESLNITQMIIYANTRKKVETLSKHICEY